MMQARLLSILLTAFVLISCGGGGGGSSEPPIPSASINLSISDTQIYIDQSVTVTWSTSNASSCSASGSWSGSKALSGNEDFSYSSSGPQTYTLTCINSEGSSTSKTVSTNVLGNINGIVVALNYLNSAEVILDLNSNFQLDDNEPTFTSSEGNFELPDDTQDIVSFEGVDSSSGTNFINATLAAKSYSSENNQKVVSAVTSFDFENSGSISTNNLLSLDENINFLIENPIVVAFDDAENDSASDKYFEVNSQLFVMAYSIQNYINQKYDNSLNSKLFYQLIYQNIFDRYETASASGVDLSELMETNTFISEYINESFEAALGESPETTGDTSVESLTSMLSSLLPIISNRSNENTTRAIIDFASGTFMNDVRSLADNTLSESTLNSYVSNINSLIASDQNIDEDSLIQTIVLVDDNITVDEDQSLDFSPLSNDSIDVGSDYYGLSVSIGNAENGTLTIGQNNVVTYTPDENFYGSDSFSYQVSVDGTTAEASVFVEVASVNDAPTFEDFISSISIEENTLNVLSVSVLDQENDTIGFSLSGADEDKLSISTSGAISFNSNPDFESPSDTNTDNQYEIIVEASDGTDSISEQLTITILDVENEGNPIIEGLASQGINENEDISISFSVTDPQNDVITSSLSGIDGDLFNLDFDGANATLTSSSKDYESPEDSDSNNTYLLNVNFSDDLNTTSQEIEISITNINDNDPIITSSSSFSVPENQTSIGTVAATDADNDEIIFSISGTDANLLEITDAGILSFKADPDFESKNSYSVTVIASDGLNSSSQVLSINVTNVNEAPIWNISEALSIDYQENTSNSETIDVPQDVYDEDGDSLSFSLSGTDAASFTISGNTVSFDGTPDYENPSDSDQDNVYSLNIVASDGSLSATSPEFIITILNLNDNNPVFVDLPESVEVTNGQQNVFEIQISDADGDEVTTSVIGTDGSLFSVSDSNELSFITAPDYANPSDNDSDNIYKINLEATDGERITTSNEISIIVLEVNNPPTISELETSYNINENVAEIATFTVSDPENNELTIGVSGDDAAGFSIVSNLLYFEGGLNFESPTDSNGDNVYEITVYADDGFNRTTQDVQITISNVEEGPEFNITEEISLEENIRVIASIEINDPEGDAFSWSITGGDDSGIMSLINVSGGSGDLRFNAIFGVDYEDPSDSDTDNVYLVQLTAAEDAADGLSTVLDLRITITDVKDTWSISGTVYSNPYTLIDGDVPDIVYYPPELNNDIDSAQTILNPTDVIGHIGDNTAEVLNLDDEGNCIEDPDNPGYCDLIEVFNEDQEDWFKFSGAPNLLLTLSIEGLIYEDSGSFYCCTTENLDADLLIYNENGLLTDFTYTSNSTSTFKQIVLPDSGNYYAVVKSIQGHTKYVLTLGSNVSGVSTLRNPQDQYAENRFISYIPFGKDFDLESYSKPIFDESITGLGAKISESQKLLPKGLRVLEFDIEDEFRKIFGDYYLEDSDNFSQIQYLKHWKLLQYFRETYPALNLELDFKEKAHFTSDPYWPYQWGLSQIGLDSVLTAIGDDVKDVAVAVLDSGSPEVTSSAWTTAAFIDGGFDFVPMLNGGDGDGYDADPTDSESETDSHGTHVATTISALNDGLNINGFGIQTLPIRVLGRDGTGYRSDIVQGMLYAAGLPNASNTFYTGSVPVKVINMSLGSTGGSCGSTYQNAINDVYATGITIVSSSGNEAQEAPGFYGYPASCNNVISVGATDFVRNRAYYSTYNDQVDIAAPGGDVTADLNADGYSDGILAFSTNEDLNFFQGTSMASPHAAGAIAVLYALVPTLQPFQVEGLLVDGFLTDDVGEEGKDDEFGYGALNLQKAVNRIISDEGLDFTYATVDTQTYNMGVEVSDFIFNIIKVGDGELSVNSIDSNISSAINITAEDIDSEGFGSYKVTLDRSSLPDGLYQTNIIATFSNENSSAVSVSFQVGADRERISIENVYAELRDDLGESIVWGRLSLPDGGASFTANDIPPGNYYWLFSTIIDDFIMDPAEFYNYYPDLSSSDEYFNLGENDIENSAVTLRVNKSTAGFSFNRSGKVIRRTIKVEDYNRKSLETISD